MLCNINPRYRVLVQATQDRAGRFIGYFMIYLSDADLALDQPHYREDRRKVTAAVSLIDALNHARQRGIDWIEADRSRATLQNN
jgi:hypothetical protein